MTDCRLRELERRFRASGSVDDEAAWLRARVQAGELSHERLGLAAYCGHDAANASLRRSAASLDLKALHRWGRLAAARTLLELCSWAHERIERKFRDAGGDAARHREVIARTLATVDAWALDPTEGKRRRLGKATAGVDKALTEAQFTHDKPLEGWLTQCLSQAVKELLQIAATRKEAAVLSAPYTSALTSCLFLTSRCWPEFHAAAAHNHRHGYEHEEAIVRRALIPWALGYSDPVRERVEVRQRAAAEEQQR